MIRPKLVGVLEISLYVEDTERSARFYQNVFGFETLVGDERLRALNIAGRQVLLLFKKGASKEPVQMPGGLLPGHDGSGTTHLTFSIPAGELEAWEKWLEENGVKIESKVTWERGGQSVYFRDPDGHLLEVATPGLWAIY
ncbi:MAG: VOC family protein [Terriglobia bacterium]